jgi:hypothetical protein
MRQINPRTLRNIIKQSVYEVMSNPMPLGAQCSTGGGEMKESYVSVPPRSLDKVLAYIRRGGTVVVRTPLRQTIIDKKTLTKFEKGGHWLLRESGDGYQMQFGKQVLNILPGQLEAVEYRK